MISFFFIRNRNGERGEMEFCDRKCLNLSTMRMTYEARVNSLIDFICKMNLFLIESTSRYNDNVRFSRRMFIITMV